MKKLITGVLLILLHQTTQSEAAEYVEPEKPLEEAEIDYFEEAVEFIKGHEGFNKGLPYNDNGNSSGPYGLHLAHFDSVPVFPWSKKQADSMLRVRFKREIEIVKYNYRGLFGSQLISVAHLSYCKGIGRVNKHALSDEIRRGVISDTTWLYFSETDRRKPKYRKNREFELKLFRL